MFTFFFFLEVKVFKALDLEFMRRLCTKVNIIPVIGENKIS